MRINLNHGQKIQNLKMILMGLKVLKLKLMKIKTREKTKKFNNKKIVKSLRNHKTKKPRNLRPQKKMELH